MGVDYSAVGGIGIRVALQDVYEKFKLGEDSYADAGAYDASELLEEAGIDVNLESYGNYFSDEIEFMLLMPEPDVVTSKSLADAFTKFETLIRSHGFTEDIEFITEFIIS